MLPAVSPYLFASGPAFILPLFLQCLWQSLAQQILGLTSLRLPTDAANQLCWGSALWHRHLAASIKQMRDSAFPQKYPPAQQFSP